MYVFYFVCDHSSQKYANGRTYLRATEAEGLMQDEWGSMPKYCELVCVTDVAMPVRAVCKPHSPDLKKRRSSDWR